MIEWLSREAHQSPEDAYVLSSVAAELRISQVVDAPNWTVTAFFPLSDLVADRVVTKLGAKGALINGFTNIHDHDTGRYLDEPVNLPFWQKVSQLNVPIYLHPREPLPSMQRSYQGYESLVGSAWGFGQETATHAVRLMLSGLFDTYPGIQIILGHLGEGLPYLLPRLEHRLDKQREGVGLGAAQRTVTEYFNNNFILTTSGHFHTRTLFNVISEIGTDRLWTM